MTLNISMITGRIDTDEELYQILQTDLNDFKDFLEEIGQFLERRQNKKEST